MAAPKRYRSILVGVDFSDASRLALARALDLARRLGSRVEVVHVVADLKPAVPFSRENRAFVAELRREQLAAAKRRLAAFVRPPPKLPVRAKVFRGRAEQVLLAHARRMRADLIVLANRGHGLAEKLLIGSTADRVLRKATVPVLLVPPVGATGPRRRPKRS